MQITVFGASGKVGRQVVAIALERGHTVRAFVHSHNPFEGQDNVEVVKGDVTDIAAVGRALEGSNAVISALGSWGTKSKNVVSSGMKAIIPAMEGQGIERIITVTGSGAFWSADKPSILANGGHTMIKLANAKVLQDGEEHLRLLEGSSLKWTCVRSPVMTKGKSPSYHLSLKLPPLWALIPRHAVAECLVDLAENNEYPRQAPIIRR